MSHARFIKHDSIRLNDLVRVAGKYADADVTRTGVVVKRRHLNKDTVYETEQGVELLTVHADNTTTPECAKVTLISRPLNSQPLHDNDPAPSLF
jgi:hypothetical protein